MNAFEPTRRRLRPGASSARACLATLLLAVLALGGCVKSPYRLTNISGYGSVHSGATVAMPPGSMPAPGEELWVIRRSRPLPVLAGAPPSAPAPGTGTLMAELGEERVAMPLRHTDVHAAVRGHIASARVRQRFHNPYDRKIEAVYVFPLPEDAAVNEFVMSLGDRRIRGILREREEAERIYAEARRQGHVATLLTQERPNVFSQSVANLEPGREIDVTLEYFHTVASVDGWQEFVFPMVVGPRFNPPGINDGVGAVRRGAAGSSGQKTEVSYLAAHERSGHDIALEVDLDPGMAIEETRCTSHRVTQTPRSPGRVLVKLDPGDAIPNRDFILRYRLAGDRVKSGLVIHRDARGGFFTLQLQPPAALAGLRRRPLEMVFVLDCSGSMHGQPLAQAKAAIERALRRLEPGDSFQLIQFSTSATQLGPAPLPATRENVRRGLAYLASLRSEGGTLMIEGIKAALDFPHDPERLRFVVFLTDGYIGNEVEILRAVHERLGESRLFSFGVGSAVNRYLLDGLARAGRGAVAYMTLKDDAAAVMDDFVARIAQPALADVRVYWGGLEVADVFPARIPDLFVGRPVVLTGRFRGDWPREIRVTGRAGTAPVEMTVPAGGLEPAAAVPALPVIWARMKLAGLAEESLREGRALPRERMQQLALDYNLLSAFTAFTAVDAVTRTGSDPAVTVPVAVPVPEGVNPRTSLPE